MLLGLIDMDQFTFTMTSKLGCDDIICNIVYSLSHKVNT